MACVQLALELDVSDKDLSDVERMTDKGYTDDACHKMLLSWWRSQQHGALALLHQALVASKMLAIAEEHKAVLLTDSKTFFTVYILMVAPARAVVYMIMCTAVYIGRVPFCTLKW